MSTAEYRADSATRDERVGKVDTKLEVIVIPVSDVDRAKEFYGRLGWRMDGDFTTGDRRVVQFTPPGSSTSIIFGNGITPSAPGSAQFLFLVVSDIVAAREALLRKGVAASEVFHNTGGGFDPFHADVRVSGPDPQRRSYFSFVTFYDPDGNGWMLQEVTSRFPGRVDAKAPTFASAQDLASALRRAAAAHHEHEKRTGEADANWPDWYAAYLAAEQSGGELPS